MNSVTKILIEGFDFVAKNILYQIKIHRENYRLSRDGRMLKRAKKVADLRHRATGKRYYVLPDHKGDLRVLNSKEIDALKRYKVMSKNVTVNDLFREALYFTK